MKLLLSVMGASLLCGGCASVSPEQYSNEQPLLDLSRYLEGPLEASGMFQNRQGEVVKRFHVKLVGTWSNNVGRLEEDFVYSDGTTQRRVWTITRIDAHHYTGTADDVVGVAQGATGDHELEGRLVALLERGVRDPRAISRVGHPDGTDGAVEGDAGQHQRC